MNPLTWQNPEQLFVAQVLKKIFYNSVAELRISKNASTDTQLICSVAESICEDNDNRHTVHSYNNVFFSNNAKLIKTGEVARSLLKSRCDSHMALLEGTISIMSE